MKTYKSLTEQSFHKFPNKIFSLEENKLTFHGIQLERVIKRHGTPLKINYLPRIKFNIRRAKKWFEDAFKQYNYQGNYIYAYCTKSNHFKFVLDKVIEHGDALETSSAFDIPIIHSLINSNKIKPDMPIICNGFKQEAYAQGIVDLINQGYSCFPVLDSTLEWEYYKDSCNKPFSYGIRKIADEEPDTPYYTSRFGLPADEIIRFVKETLMQSTAGQLKILHFFINTGMKDSAYFWNELDKLMHLFVDIRQLTQSLSMIDLGGGLPILSDIENSFDYAQLINAIVSFISDYCKRHAVPTPDLITEFGRFTVGETGALFYSVLEQRKQSKYVKWYMIDGSFITHLPDAWGLNEKYILLPINGWDHLFTNVNLGGLTCDEKDYYISEAHSAELFLPELGKGPLYIGFFHTGAYQEALGGYGGIQHCLIPSPKHVVIDRDSRGELTEYVFREQESPERMGDILGYGLSNH